MVDLKAGLMVARMVVLRVERRVDSKAELMVVWKAGLMEIQMADLKAGLMVERMVG